jgi:hypothetical protein
MFKGDIDIIAHVDGNILMVMDTDIDIEKFGV